VFFLFTKMLVKLYVSIILCYEQNTLLLVTIISTYNIKVREKKKCLLRELRYDFKRSVNSLHPQTHRGGIYYIIHCYRAYTGRITHIYRNEQTTQNNNIMYI